MITVDEIVEPQVIEELSYQEIIDEMMARFHSIMPDFTGILESDPVVGLFEVCAYRELLLRQVINQAAESNLLAYATGLNLDALGELYGLTRRPGESDDEFRARIKRRISGFSSAGSKAAYIFHAMEADSRVKEANADSPMPGLVRISILSKENGGIASEDLLTAVNNYIQREDIRVLTDTVQVVGCGIIDFNVRAKITLSAGTSPAYLSELKAQFAEAYKKKQGLGKSISRSWIISQLFTSGVSEVELFQPVEDLNVSEIECTRLVGTELFL